MDFKDLHKLIKENQNHWIRDLNSRMSLSNNVKNQFYRMNTWESLREAYWAIFPDYKYLNHDKMFEICEEIIQNEKIMAYESMFCRSFSFDTSKINQFYEILRNTNGIIQTYEQFFHIMVSVFELPKERVSKVYFDLKEGDFDKQIFFFLKRFNILFSEIPNGYSMVEDFFSIQLSVIRNGLINEPSKEIKTRDKYPYVNHLWTRFLKDIENECLSSIGKRAFQILKNFVFIDLKIFEEKDETIFEILFTTENEFFSIKCAEFEMDWIEWFQFSADEEKFERIFHIESESLTYGEIQYLFEEFNLKDYMREHIPSSNI
jgi:hypothetical protein